MKLFFLVFLVSCASGAELLFFLLSNYCGTKQCRQIGFDVDHSMYSTTDPCQNFYKYSCGGWIAKNTRPPSEMVWNHWQATSQRIGERLQAILAEDHANQNLRKSRQVFETCMNPNSSVTYLEELRLLVHSFDGWPLATETWHASGYDWLTHVAEVTRFLGVQPIVQMHVDVNFKNTSQHTIYIEHGNTIMPRYVLLYPENHMSQLLVYKHWILDSAKHIYPNRSFEHLNEEVSQMIDFEIRLAQLLSTKTKMKKSTIGALSEITNVTWTNIFQRLFSRTSVDITEEDHVMYSRAYMENLLALIKKTKTRVVANYIVWHVIKDLSRDTDRYMRKLNFLVDKKIFHVQADIPRDQECLAKTIEYISAPLVSKYVELFVKPGTLDAVKHMARNIKIEFVKVLKKNDWLTPKTKQAALEKIMAQRFLIGYPDWMTNETLVDDVYKNITVTDNHFINVLNLKRLLVRTKLEELKAPVNQIRWPSSPFEVNGFFSVLQNSISTYFTNALYRSCYGAFFVMKFLQFLSVLVMPLGMLEAPFFDVEIPPVFNYGALGSLIGHELVHALDTTGRRADKDGNIRNWWSEEDVETYERNVECFRKQYYKYGIDGHHTLGENIADNVGLKISFRAFLRMKVHMRIAHLERYATEQLFFISYAQMWCEISDTLEYLNDEEHAPVQIRVIGTMNNSREFETAFHCQQNDVNKCNLW